MTNGVKLNVNKLNPYGEFYLNFSQEPQVNFYASENITSVQRFRRYGNLPDNNVAINKIINKLGSHLLTMEVKGAKIKNENKEKYHSIEKMANALYIDLFCELADLEKYRLTKVLDKKSLNQRIEQIFDEYIRKFEGIPEAEMLIPILKEKKANLIQAINELELDNYELRKFYQSTLIDFRDVQQEISFLQRPFLGVGEIDNSSVTEAYNEALYELEAHKFGNFAPNDKQLWKVEDGFLSTEELTNYSKDDALKTVCINQSGQYKEEDYKNARKDIKDTNLKVKKKQGSGEKIAEASLQNLPDYPIPTNFLREDPLIYFEESDLFSALGSASLMVGKYFEKDIGAKHPVVSLGFFLTASITFTAAGLGSLGVAPGLMNKIILGVSKVLSVGGKLVSPDKIANTINIVSEEWLHLCHANGKLIQTLIMNGMGLPKLTFIGGDSFINGLEGRDTLNVLVEKLIPENLTGELRSEEVKRICLNVIQASFVFGVAIAAGIGSEQLLTQKGIWGTVGKIINQFADVPSATFTDLVNAGDAVQEFQAIVAALLTVKTAGLLVGKVFLLFVNMTAPDAASEEELQAFNVQKNAVQMMELLLLMKDVNPQAFQQYQKPAPEVIEHFNNACQNHPQIKEKFQKEAAFLNSLGINSISESESFSSSLARGVGSIFGILPGFFYPLVTSFSPSMEKKSISLAKNNDFLGGFNNSAKFISDKFFAPIWGFLIFVPLAILSPILDVFVYLFSFIFPNLESFSFSKLVYESKGFADALKVITALLRIIIFVLTPFKMVLMGIFELVKRVLMFVVNLIAKAVLLLNAIWKGDLGAFKDGFLSSFFDILGIAGLVVDQIIGVFIVIAVGVVDLLISIINILPTLYHICRAIFNAISEGWEGKSFKDGFFEVFDEDWKGVLDTFGAFTTRRAYLDEHSLFVMCKDQSADYEINMIKQMEGYENAVTDIQKSRHKFLASIHYGFGWIERMATKLVTWVRSKSLRSLEEKVQTMNYTRLGYGESENTGDNVPVGENHQNEGIPNILGVTTSITSQKKTSELFSKKPTHNTGHEIKADDDDELSKETNQNH